MDADQLDLIHAAASQLNDYGYMDGRAFGIVAVGDFCQLPPVKARYAFDANCWGEFDENTLKLSKVWRQDDPIFLEALNLIRRGEGQAGAETLQEAGVTFSPNLDMQFAGCTVVGKNEQVNRINAVRYSQLLGKEFELPNFRWGQQRSEWKVEKGLIPFSLKMKPGALVMILANEQTFEYANGDLGEVIEQDPEQARKYGVQVRLKRNGEVVTVPRVERHFSIRTGGDDRGLDHFRCACVDKEDEERMPRAPWGKESWNCRDGSVVGGAVSWYPLRLSYASTIHKCQGLTLDAIQFDPRDAFAGSPQMSYVALSRCRTAGGLRVVGSPGLLGKRVTIDDRVRKFL